jgi:hypothetical protein
MAQEAWTDYPDMTWWKDYPDRWLLSVKADRMHNRAYGAYHRILCHMRREKPPGVILFSETRVMELGRMRESEFKTDRNLLLSAFRMYSDGTLHHEFLKELYRNVCRERYEAYVSGKISRARKVSKGKRGSSGPDSLDKPLPYRDPYGAWDKVDNWVANENRDSASVSGGLRGPIGGLSTPVGSLPIREEERREDKIFSSTQTASSPDGQNAGEENASFHSHLKKVVAEATTRRTA